MQWLICDEWLDTLVLSHSHAGETAIRSGPYPLLGRDKSKGAPRPLEKTKINCVETGNKKVQCTFLSRALRWESEDSLGMD